MTCSQRRAFKGCWDLGVVFLFPFFKSPVISVMNSKNIFIQGKLCGYSIAPHSVEPRI